MVAAPPPPTMMSTTKTRTTKNHRPHSTRSSSSSSSKISFQKLLIILLSILLFVSIQFHFLFSFSNNNEELLTKCQDELLHQPSNTKKERRQKRKELRNRRNQKRRARDRDSLEGDDDSNDNNLTVIDGEDVETASSLDDIISANYNYTSTTLNSTLFEELEIDFWYSPSKVRLPAPNNNNNNNNNTTKVVYFVFSRHSAFDIRKTIRNTWGSNVNNDSASLIYFVIGKPCWIPSKYRGTDLGKNIECRITDKQVLTNRFVIDAQIYNEKQLYGNILPKLKKEFIKYQDLIIMTDQYDTYGNLPEKLKTAYKFTYKYLSSSSHHNDGNIKYVVKVDDDFYVRVQKFTNYLLNEIPMIITDESDDDDPIVIGGCIPRSKPVAMAGKWKEKPQWPLDTYPPFPMGSCGHVVTRPIWEYIAKNSQFLFNYQGEDNSLGIWINQSSISNIAQSTRFIDSNVMYNNGNCSNPDLFVIGHDMNAEKMNKCHKLSTKMGRK